MLSYRREKSVDDNKTVALVVDNKNIFSFEKEKLFDVDNKNFSQFVVDDLPVHSGP